MYLNSMYKSLQHVILKSPVEAFINQEYLNSEWKRFNYSSAPNYDEALHEYRMFEAIIKKYVKKIDYLPQNDNVGIDSIYAHDPVKFTPNGAIILNSGKTLRQKEADVYKEFLLEHDIAVIGQLSPEALCDGGDIVWIDDHTLAVGQGYRTNDIAIEEIRNITSDFVDDFIVVPLPHDKGEEECLHLMSVVSIIDEDLAVVYSPLMPVFFRRLLLNKGFKLIEVCEEEYDNLGGNVLALAPRVCVVPSGNPKIVSNIKSNGVTVHEYKGDEITYKGTGGPTCLTSPVVRC